MTNQIKNLAQQLLSSLETNYIYLDECLPDEALFNPEQSQEFTIFSPLLDDEQKFDFKYSLFEFSLIYLSVYTHSTYQSSSFILNCLTRFLKKSDEELSKFRIENSNVIKSKTQPKLLDDLNHLEFIFWLFALAGPKLYSTHDNGIKCLELIIKRNNEATTPILDLGKTVFIQQVKGETIHLKLSDSFFYWNSPHQNHTLSSYHMLGLDIYTPDNLKNPFKYNKRKEPHPFNINSSMNILYAFTLYKKAIQLDTQKNYLPSETIYHLLNLTQIHEQFNHIFPIKTEVFERWNQLVLLNQMIKEDNDSDKIEKWIDITKSMQIDRTKTTSPAEILEANTFNGSKNYLFFVLNFYLNIGPHKEALLNSKELAYQSIELKRFYLFARENETTYKRFSKTYPSNFFKQLQKDIHEKDTSLEVFKTWFEDCFSTTANLSEDNFIQETYAIPKNEDGLFDFELDKLDYTSDKHNKNNTKITLIEKHSFEKLDKRIKERAGNDEFKNLEILYKQIKEKDPKVVQNGLIRELSTLDNVQKEKHILLKEMFPHMNEVTDFIFEQMNLSKLGNNAIQFPPILLNGPAGTGKTFFFKMFSELLSLDINFINSPSINASWAISGLEPSWLAACPGLVFDTLMNSSTANPIILLDELDKVSKGEKYGKIEDVLLGLFEKHSAKEFKDSFISDLKIDASHIIWVCTSNNISQISTPMKSRLKIFEVPIPDKMALKQLGRNVYSNLRKNNQWGSFFDNEIPEETLELLVTNNGSVRDMRKYIEFAFARAANENSSKILPQHLKIKQMPVASQPWHRKLES